MQETYERRLSMSEAKRHYVHILKEYRAMFPRSGGPVRIIIGDDEVEVEIDREGRIWASLFWDHLDFGLGKTIIFTKNPDGSFNVSNKE